MKIRIISTIALAIFFLGLNACTSPQKEELYYCNPLYYADYSDPDVIRVGDDFYMVTSSFTYSPGLPVYHSKDLVHWQIISHVVDRHPTDFFDVPRHGMGVWAPSIRYHEEYFWVYYGDPDFGIYMSKAKDPAGPWAPLTLVHTGKGMIDPCPFWDDDGNAYLVRAWAKSRAGINSVLIMHRMSPEGDRLLDDGMMIFDGTETQPTIEGPKMYKRNGFYYIFAPAGGVTPGWQTVLRSQNVFGPYEERIVMHQGNTDINGPHQGGWVELESGEHWFVHFQCNYAYGRMLHLNPLEWRDDDWPIIGVDAKGEAIGEPVRSFRYPNTGNPPQFAPQQTSDNFEIEKLSLQWRWQANWRQDWFSLTEKPGYLRLYSLPVENQNLYTISQVLTQKFPAEAFEATTKMHIGNLKEGDVAGLAATGDDYATLRISRTKDQTKLAFAERLKANEDGNLNILKSFPIDAEYVYLRMNVKPGAICSFSYSLDGENFTALAEGFQAKRLRWVGSSIGLYCFNSRDVKTGGSADFEWFRVKYDDPNL
jgi:beta-xylosidase